MFDDYSVHCLLAYEICYSNGQILHITLKLMRKARFHWIFRHMFLIKKDYKLLTNRYRLVKAIV
jgi:hypothetical protein